MNRFNDGLTDTETRAAQVSEVREIIVLNYV